MPYKDKKEKAKQMRRYRKKKKTKLKEAKIELMKDKPSVPRLRELLGVDMKRKKK